MAKTQKNRKSLSSQAKSVIALAVLLVITVFVSCLGIAGMKLDKDGVRVLLPFMPFKKDMKAYTLSLQMSTGEERTLKFAPAEEGADTAAMMQETKDIISKRLKAYGVNDAKLEEKDGNLVVTVPSFNEEEMRMVDSLLASVGRVEFKDAQGNVLLNNADFASVKTGFQNGYTFLEMKMTKEGKARLTEATQKTMGSTMGFYLDGQQMINPRVDEVNDSGSMMISVGLVPSATKALAVLMENDPLPTAIAELTTGESGSVPTSLYTTLMIVFWAAFAVLGVFFAVRFRMAGLGSAWTMWAYLLCFFFLQATVTLVTVSVGVWVMAALGLALCAYTLTEQLKGMEKAAAEGRDANAAVRAGFRGSAKMTWIVNGGALAVSLLLMILNVTRPMGYTLATCVVANVLVSMGLARWFVPCMVRSCGSKVSAITGKASKQ